MSDELLKINLLTISLIGGLLALVGLALYFAHASAGSYVRYLLPLPPVAVAAYVFTFNYFKDVVQPTTIWGIIKDVFSATLVAMSAFFCLSLISILLISFIRHSFFRWGQEIGGTDKATLDTSVLSSKPPTCPTGYVGKASQRRPSFLTPPSFRRLGRRAVEVRLVLWPAVHRYAAPEDEALIVVGADVEPPHKRETAAISAVAVNVGSGRRTTLALGISAGLPSAPASGQR